MEFDPFSPEFKTDPYPFYAQMRREAPVLVLEAANMCIVTRYDDVVSVLRNPTLFSSNAIGMRIQGRDTRTIINTDPPLHTQLRGLINRAFTPRIVADLEPRIREITAGLIDNVVESGRTDIVRDLAVPLPVTVIAQLLGVDPQRHDDFKRWSTAVVTQDTTTDPEGAARVELDIAEFTAYFAGVMEERRRAPGDDLISLLLVAEEGELKLTPDDLIAFTALLLVAGNETTTNLIGNAVLALLQHPEQLERLRTEPGLLPNAIEEALRWDSPVQFLFRQATDDALVGETKIPAGMTVIPAYASANRDERRFPEAERFDITRNTQGHVAFGYGVHFCLGAPLARLEARVALEQMLERMPAFRRADDVPPERVNSLFLRGILSLPLEFEAAGVAGTAVRRG